MLYLMPKESPDSRQCLTPTTSTTEKPACDKFDMGSTPRLPARESILHMELTPDQSPCCKKVFLREYSISIRVEYLSDGRSLFDLKRLEVERKRKGWLGLRDPPKCTRNGLNASNCIVNAEYR
jgi:hypothetical protein